MDLQHNDIFFLQEQIAFKRDERSYKRLFIYFYKPLVRFALSFIKNAEAAEEIVSDIMMKVWLMKEELTAITNLKVYLYRGVKNACINYFIRNNKYPIEDIENTEVILNPDLYTPEDLILKKEITRKILAAVSELPPKCQMVYKLVREDGLSYHDVAGIMNISENTVDRHLNIALHKLVTAVKTYL